MIINADARQIPLADKSVQCVVTSPPYWGLRDYGTATWVGGDEGCDHKAPPTGGPNPERYTPGGGEMWRLANDKAYSTDCPKCGATRIDSQIGLESTPEAYVAKIVAVFSEVWRVLRDDGVCFVNLGDSYAGNPAKGASGNGKESDYLGDRESTKQMRRPLNGLKPKDLVGIPWRVAFALQAAGWYLRSDIIWSKPNPMPESVTDRPTKAHEYIFLLTKKERYYFDQDAVRELPSENTHKRAAAGQLASMAFKMQEPGNGNRNNTSFQSYMQDLPEGTLRNIRTVWEIATQPYPEAHFATFPEEIAIRCIKAGTSEKGACAECGAPWERVTDINYSPANHHGTSLGVISTSLKQDQREVAGNGSPGFRAKLNKESKTLGWQPTCKHGIDRTIINSPMGTRSGNDPSLITGRAGMNRPRGTDEGQRPITRYEQQQYAEQLTQSQYRKQMEGEAGQAFAHYIRTDESGARPVPDELLDVWIERGWLNRVVVPEVNSAPTVPCVVLDPFSGAGTVPLVADKLNRHGIGLELKSDYCRMAHERCYDDAPLLGYLRSVG